MEAVNNYYNIILIRKKSYLFKINFDINKNNKALQNIIQLAFKTCLVLILLFKTSFLTS